MKFLRVSRNIVLTLQFLTIASMFIGSITLLFYPDTIRTYKWVGFSLLPENRDLLKNYEDIDIRFKPDPEIEAHLVIEQTQVQMNGILPEMRVGLWIFFILFGGLLYIILSQLGRMIKSVEDGDPFNSWNVKRIYFLTILLACFPLLGRAFRYWQKYWIKANFEMEGVFFSNEPFELLPWLLPVILLATVGKIIEMGMEIKKEQELTI